MASRKLGSDLEHEQGEGSGDGNGGQVQYQLNRDPNFAGYISTQAAGLRWRRLESLSPG